MRYLTIPVGPQAASQSSPSGLHELRLHYPSSCAKRKYREEEVVTEMSKLTKDLSNVAKNSDLVLKKVEKKFQVRTARGRPRSFREWPPLESQTKKAATFW